MLSRFVRITAAVLSGVTASLLVGTTTTQAAQNGPVVVYGEPQENVRTEHVSHADLDLALRSHERRLNRRVAGAVKRVCLFDYSRPGLQDGTYYSCAGGAWDGARPQIEQAVVRAREIALTGKSSIAATAISINVPAL